MFAVSWVFYLFFEEWDTDFIFSIESFGVQTIPFTKILCVVNAELIYIEIIKDRWNEFRLYFIAGKCGSKSNCFFDELLVFLRRNGDKIFLQKALKGLIDIIFLCVSFAFCKKFVGGYLRCFYVLYFGQKWIGVVLQELAVVFGIICDLILFKIL